MNIKAKLRWFYVAADYKAVHLATRQRRHLWERRVFVFRATRETAKDKALEIAKRNEHEYVTAYGDTLRWTFKGIESTAELFDKRITDGTEVYWDWFVRVDKPRPQKTIAKSKWKTRQR